MEYSYELFMEDVHNFTLTKEHYTNHAVMGEGSSCFKILSNILRTCESYI